MNLCNVLILVLMEDTLRVDNVLHIGKSSDVLILVLMEDTLRAAAKAAGRTDCVAVLILVLMEDTLREEVDTDGNPQLEVS